jgi:hypothetical protein
MSRWYSALLVLVGACAGAGSDATQTAVAGASPVITAGRGGTAATAPAAASVRAGAGGAGSGASAVAGSRSTPGGAVAGRPASPGMAAPGAAGKPAAMGGAAGSTNSAGAAGSGMAAAGSGMAAAGSAGTGSTSGAEFEAERQACVDTINMYRAELMLAPLKRATPELEKCSDMGAKKDGDSGQGHSSAGDCRPLAGQNSCPGYPVRGGDVAATLKMCLAQMWAEGPPPNGVDACIQDSTGCFLMHGHWINMQMAQYKTVGCGFYKMSDGRYWMNQNFGYQ